MPIPGLTDNMPSFKEIGRLRKGKPKTEGLGDLDYFRPDFRPDETEAATRFTQFYGATPKWVYVRLPFPQIERCWDANFEVYNTAGMLGSAGGKTGEPLHWFYLRDPKTGEVKVKNGEPFTPFDPKVPIYSYKNKRGQDVPVFAKATGRLRVVVPETGKLNYMTLITHSLYDIANISEQLQGIDYIAKNIGMSLSTVPLVMSRRWELRSVSYNGRKEMKELNLINIDVRSDWAGKQFGFLDQLMPGQTPAILTLPAQVIDYGDEDQEPEYQDGGEDYDPTQTDAPQFVEPDDYQDSDFDPSDLDAPFDEEVDAVETPKPGKDLTKPASWPAVWLQQIVKLNYAKNDFEAAGMLSKSSVIRPEFPYKPIVIGGWAKHYRAQRDADASIEIAAAFADSKLQEFGKK